MARWTARREGFRRVLESNHCVHPASVFDPMSARIAQDLGFECGIFAGSVASMVVLGAPDVIVLTLSEFAEQAYRISRASELPLLVDADHGYGNALNVMRTVHELETAGVAALSIEDTVLPRPFGAGGNALISIEEGVGKMRAALAARQDAGLVIAGRTSAPALTNIKDAITRAKAYQAAGVDAIFLVGIKSREQLDALAAELTVPIILGGASERLIDRADLASRGVRICLQSHRPVMAAVGAVYDTLHAFRQGIPPPASTAVASPELMKQVTRDDDYVRWGNDFLDGEASS